MSKPFRFLSQDLLLLEEQEGSVNFKFGVLYALAGQTTDDEMFSNGENTLLLFFYTKPLFYIITWHIVQYL